MIGYYHFILAYTGVGIEPLWGKRPIYGFRYSLDLRQYQVEIDWFGLDLNSKGERKTHERVWINTPPSCLTFRNKDGVPYINL